MQSIAMQMCRAFAWLLALPLPSATALFGRFPPSGQAPLYEPPAPVLGNCSEQFFEQTLDHYGRAAPGRRFAQRYFLCEAAAWAPGDPIFLYVGNEADVELYLNATGLMWESAPHFNAKLVFVEHRYFGKSMPQSVSGEEPWPFLTTDQALADFTAFALALRKSILHAPRSPIVGFGGSYGGMLCAWLRISAPWAVDACLAASAPIMSFMGLDPPVNPNFYAQVVTQDASEAGGSSNLCSERIHAAWSKILNVGSSPEGKETLKQSFRLCSSPTDAWDVAIWLSSALDYMAMGSYPYPSSYILNGRAFMPPYPLRKACGIIASAPEDEEKQFEAFREAVAIFYNASGAAGSCFNTKASGNKETTEDAQKWDYLYCAGVLQVFGRDGVHDMYWNAPWNLTAAQETCMAQHGLWPNPEWVAERFGGWQMAKTATRILFSNGALDPWKGGGVTESLAPELPAVLIPEVGHHIDLMWSHQDDPPAVKEARRNELAWIQKWVAASASELAETHAGGASGSMYI